MEQRTRTRFPFGIKDNKNPCVVAESNGTNSKSNGGIISSERLSSDDRKQATFLVEEQIFGDPKLGMEANEQNGDDQRHQDIDADVGGDERNDSD
ncbi:hypothetical protein Fmac_015878 [Flemingia macrophylla]|uniref:Uncharacterized protein n=1 Tax=Flemingia macrophylla TaxID=520843 RepID=A0ABD1MFS9_9FABA